MTSTDRFEQRLPDLMADLAAARIPDYFDEMLQETARTRQRPAWSSLERWLPLSVTTLSPVSNRTRSLAGLLVLALVGLLMLAGVAAYVGSHTVHLPAPFGPAGNGLMYYSGDDGDIYSVDPTKGAPKAIVTGPTTDAGPLPSRDGRRIAFTRTMTGGTELIVADADGLNVLALPGTWVNFDRIDWSSDGTHLAIISDVKGVPSLTVMATDGSGGTTLPIGLETHEFWYLPDGRIVFKGTDNGAAGPTYGLYVVNADGTGLHPILPPTSGESDLIGVNPSPDGRSLVYHVWRDAPSEHGRLYVVDIASGQTHQVVVDGTTPDEEFEGAQFSPDGSHILFARYRADGDRLAVVPVGGGAAISIGPTFVDDQTPANYYSPDGRSIVAYYPTSRGTWLLDPTGGQNGGDRKLSLAVSDAPAWQRVAP
jgi:Tol biopolymer transport system component